MDPLALRVIARSLGAKDFASPEALREYLKEHPNADKSKHHVVREEGGRGSGAAHVKTKVDKGVADEISKVWKGPSGNAVDAVRKMIEEDREIPLNMLDKAVTVLHDQSNKPGIDKAKAKALRGLRDKLKGHAQGKEAHMNDPLTSRVIERHAALVHSDSEHDAIVFPSEEALRNYVKEHPRADPRNHTVKKPKHDDKAAPAENEKVEEALKYTKSVGNLIERMLSNKTDRDVGNQLPHHMEVYKDHIDQVAKGINSIPPGKERERAKKIDREIDDAFESINKEHGYRWKGKRYMPPDTADKVLKKTKPLVEELDKLLSGQRTLMAADPLTSRVLDRYAKEFPTPQALRDYLREHPQADKSKHHVAPQEKVKTPVGKPPSEWTEQELADYKKELKEKLDSWKALDNKPEKAEREFTDKEKEYSTQVRKVQDYIKKHDKPPPDTEEYRIPSLRKEAQDPLTSRVLDRYFRQLVADQDPIALTFPREFHLPPHVRPTPAHIPEGTDLAVWTWDQPVGPQQVTRYFLIIFAGKANKPFVGPFYYKDEAARQRVIDETVTRRKEFLQGKQQRQQERKDFKHNITVGEIFYTSWGYDQTNVTFYEVVDLKEKAIVVRPIGSKLDHSERGADYVTADKGHFTGPPKTVIPGPGYGGHATFKIDDHHASPWDGSPKYETPFGMGH